MSLAILYHFIKNDVISWSDLPDFLMTSESRHLSSAAMKISGITTRIRRPRSGVIRHVHSTLAGYRPGQLGLWM